MLDKLIDIILQVIDDLVPWVVIPHYDRGVRLRLGKLRGGVMDCGFHWKIPFADQIQTHMVMPTTMNLSEQSVVTLDGTAVVVKAVIKYEVEDVQRLLLEVNSASDALSDMAQGIIRDKLIETAWSDCNNAKLTSDISRAIKMESKKWGIKVLTVILTDLSPMRSIRLLNSVK